ncbi:MAG: hypothetical protein A2176_10485 [Spirochaetes bacterium RBG_13_51_14]|nr:MAG: hypothetical protein A2176_10485 [Spirochaetes bacterium RBG_13_51_14]
MGNKKYILITSAYNEEKNIEKTIQSVIVQSILPAEWIIVSDGSTDKTNKIIQSYQKKYKFINFIRMPAGNTHSFASKVFALQAGFESLKNKYYDFIGILDADVSFEKNYFKEIITRFENDENLGVAGGNIIEYSNGVYMKRIKTLNSVAGAVQLFRKECFDDTIGFQPFEYGGEDAVVEISARMKGWAVKTFPEIEVIHHGFVGGKNLLRTRYRRGIRFFLLGYHPVFNIVRCIFRMRERPILIGSFVELIGFFYAYMKYKKSKLPVEVVCYLRNEQIQRLKHLLKFYHFSNIKDQISY